MTYCYRIFFILSNWFILLETASVGLKPKEYRNLIPLPCSGYYDKNRNPSSESRLAALFLGPEKMVVQKKGDGSYIAKGIVPVPVKVDVISPLLSAKSAHEYFARGINKNKTEENIRNDANLIKSSSGSLITERNQGIFDSLSEVFSWAGFPNARRLIYDRLRLKGSCISPYHGLLESLSICAGLAIKGLLLEVADTIDFSSSAKSDQLTSKEAKLNGLVLGGAVLIVKNKYASNDRWHLSADNFVSIKASRGSDEAIFLNCPLDELIGLSIASGLPITVASPLYDSLCVDGLISNPNTAKEISITAPYFSSPAEMKLWQYESQRRETKRVEISKSFASAPRAHDIKSASTFLRMGQREKRAVLRATGVPGSRLPRPREGSRALDALLIPLLNEEVSILVAYEVLRRLAETGGNFEQAAEMNDYESRKPEIARKISEARRRGDNESAKQLCDELNRMSILRFDPTNPNGPPGEWDVEEWYWEQRKQIHGIIAA